MSAYPHPSPGHQSHEVSPHCHQPELGEGSTAPVAQWGPHHMAVSPSCVHVPIIWPCLHHVVFPFHAHVPIMCLCTSRVSPSCVPVMSVFPSHVHVSTARLQPHHIPVSPLYPMSPPYSPVFIPSLCSHVPIMSPSLSHTVSLLHVCPCCTHVPTTRPCPITQPRPCCMPVSPSHACVPTTCSWSHCTLMSLLHTHVPVAHLCPYHVSPLHACIPAAHPRPHHMSMSP